VNRILKLQCHFGTVISLIFLITHSPPWWGERFFLSGPDLCQAWMPTSQLRSLYDALICGTNLPSGHEKQIFVDTGLIHLMVVSGSHLVFLEILLGFLPSGVLKILLGAYCYLTGFQAPVVRAFLRRLIGPTFKARKGMTSLQVEAAAVVIALGLYPEWLGSRSFLMSWMCGLALAAPKIFPRAPHFDLAVKAYVFLLPFCWASPLSVAWNTLLAPFVGFLLFPTCILAILIPPLVPLSDGMWRGFLMLLDLGPQGSQSGMFFSSWSLCWIPAATHLALLIWEVRWRRVFAFSVSRFS
jgi:predicted membrane metal-binding protein